MPSLRNDSPEMRTSTSNGALGFCPQVRPRDSGLDMDKYEDNADWVNFKEEEGGGVKKRKRGKKRGYYTCYSHVVSHRSTRQASTRLTSVIGRELVH